MSTMPQPPAGGESTRGLPAAPPASELALPQESLGYQPISGWVIGGFAISALFTLLVVSCAIVALYLGAPVFFPVYTLLVAVCGVVLSWVGLKHVQNSEGTRAGARLARVGIWLSLISGLCYFSYWYFTGLAVQSQANAFLMEIGEDSGFFPRLKEGATRPTQFNAAFLLTLPANQRAEKRPDNENDMRRLDKPGPDGTPGKLTEFRENVFARLLFGEPAKDVEITPLAVQEWKYSARQYQVQRLYRIKTREVVIEMFITVQSSEGETAGEGRKWFINLNESGPAQPPRRELTAAGKGIQLLRMQARDKLDDWFKSLNDGIPVKRFDELDKTAWERLRIAEKDKPVARAAVKAMFEDGRKNHVTGYSVGADDIGNWDDPDGKVRMHFTMRFKLELQLSQDAGRPASPLSYATCHVVMATKQAMDPAQFDPTSTPPDWDVVRITIVHLMPLVDKGGPGGPG